MAKIKEIHSREILNSRGLPTIETVVVLNDGTIGVASVPSTDFVSQYSAVNLLDHEQNRYQGQGVLKAVGNITSIIAPKLIGLEASRQQEIDKTLLECDGTQNKGRLGANATLSVSVAIAKAAAKTSVLPLYLYLRQFIKHENSSRKVPTLLFGLLNGSRRTGNLLDFKDFLIVPASFKTFEESLQICSSLQLGIRTVLQQKNQFPLFSLDGGFAPSLTNNSEAFLLFAQALETVNLRLGYDVFFGIDAAANTFYTDGKYRIQDKSSRLSSDELIAFYTDLINTYHILYVEDPLHEDDWEGWEKIAKQISLETILVGDFLTATNPYRLQMALDKKAVTGITIKPIQIGTVIEALAVTEIARISGLKIIVADESGATTDDFLADFAVAVSADYVNFGPLTRGEHVVKYNRLSEIEKQLKQL